MASFQLPTRHQWKQNCEEKHSSTYRMVNFTHQLEVPRLNIISGSVRIFLDRISIWISDSVDCPPQSVWTSSNPLKARTERKVEEEGIRPLFSASLLSRDILPHLLWSLDWDLHCRSPCFSGLWTQIELHPWLSWVSSLQTVGHGISQVPQSCELIPHNKSLHT